MSVTVQWSNPQHTELTMQFSAPWTWADFEQVSPQINAALASVEHLVNVVVDVSRAGELPEDALYQLRQVYGDDTPNVGQYIFVGASPEFQALFGAADRYYTALGGELNYRFVELV